jgi:hypothetical protein
MEDTRSNKSRKSRGKNISSVQDSDTGRDFLTSIEHRKQVDRTRIIRCFSYAQEEAREQQALEVLRQSSQSTDDSPEHHANTHVARRPGTVEKHVGGDLAEEIADEEDGDTGLVLCAGEVEVFFEVVEAGEGDGVAVLNIKLVNILECEGYWLSYKVV